MTFRLPDINTRFALPIVCPTTGEHVSAETLYNRACDAMDHVIRDHIGDLILDNLAYDPEADDDTGGHVLNEAVYAWAATVREQLALWGDPAILNMLDEADAVCGRSPQATGRLTADFASRAYPWRVVIMVEGGRDYWTSEDRTGWAIYQVFEEASEAEAERAGHVTALEVLDEPGVTNAHYYVGEVAL